MLFILQAMEKFFVENEMPEDQLSCERIDPRIRRTRQMFFDSLETLLRSRAMDEISVADIAGHAGLNRATFYDHYPDKFALLEGLVQASFHRLLSQRQVRFDGTCAFALKSLALATCDYLAGTPERGCSAARATERHFEAAVSGVVRDLLLGGLRAHPPRGGWQPELIAATISGGIYGAAREWANGARSQPAESVAEVIFGIYGPLLATGAPTAFTHDPSETGTR